MPLTINSCSRNNPIDIDCENLNELESIYCINGNSSATIVWNAPIEFTQFSIYRDTLQDVKIISQNLKKTYQSIPRGYFKDENLENGKTYYYKILFEKNCDGQIKRILSELVTEAHPLNYNIDSSLITFQNHVKPILNSSCSVKGCHNSNDKIPFTSWNNLMEEDEGVSWIIPFKSSKSHLIYHINNDSLLTPISKPEMPSVEVKLPTEQIKLIMNWIDNGAKNENGVIPFTSISDDGVAIVTNQGEDLSAVIDLNLKRITRFVTTGVNDTKVNPPHAPHNVTIDNKNKFYYVNLISGNKLLKFQLSDHKKVGELSSGIISPSQAALNFSGDTAFVANFTSSQSAISVINTNSMSIIQNITDPRMIAPHGISITPNGKYVLSANQFSDNITIINSATLEVVDVIPLSAKLSLPPSATKIYEPYQSIITKDSKYAFITCANSNEVRVLDIEEKKIVDSISVGNRPLILDIAPNGENIYVANRNSNSVSIINVSQRKVTSTIQNVGQQPHGISVSSKGNLVIVSCENLLTSEQPHHPTSGGKNIGIVTLISTATNSIIKKIEVGNFAAGVATTK
ncbi:MAG: YncE family protein [Bacteroidetes bacterium]|nr:YncE family protein [Bacteroidota bacterium]